MVAALMKQPAAERVFNLLTNVDFIQSFTILFLHCKF
jgi:hypothetical protein